MENNAVSSKDMKVKKVRKSEPKVVTLQIGRVTLVHDKKGLTYHVPQAMTGAELARFIEKNRSLIEAFRKA